MPSAASRTIASEKDSQAWAGATKWPKWEDYVFRRGQRTSGREALVRAYFLRDGRIREVAILNGMTDNEAIKQAIVLFKDKGDKFDGVEVWEETRQVYWQGHPFGAGAAIEKPR